MRRLVLALVCLVAAAPAAAQQMNAESFHQRATKLQSKGAMALFSMGDVKALMREGKAASEVSVARYKAEKAAGKPTRYCPPPGPQKMDDKEFMRRLSAIPQADRQRIDMTEAFSRIMAAKFPCPKA
jgi:DNA-binding transcriptional regulator LsrR (DeoR family)